MEIDFQAYTHEKYSVILTPHGISFILYMKFDLICLWNLEMRSATNVHSY